MSDWTSQRMVCPHFDVTHHKTVIRGVRYSIEEEHWDEQAPLGPPHCTVCYVDESGKIRYLGSCPTIEQAKAMCEWPS